MLIPHRSPCQLSQAILALRIILRHQVNTKPGLFEQMRQPFCKIRSIRASRLRHRCTKNTRMGNTEAPRHQLHHRISQHLILRPMAHKQFTLGIILHPLNHIIKHILPALPTSLRKALAAAKYPLYPPSGQMQKNLRHPSPSSTEATHNIKVTKTKKTQQPSPLSTMHLIFHPHLIPSSDTRNPPLSAPPWI